MSLKKTNFFFIDEQGSLNNDHRWLLRGGYLIDVNDYLNLNKKIKKLNVTFLGETREIKWSHVSAAIFQKERNKPLTEDFQYLDKFTIEELKEYLGHFFKLVSQFNIKIIFNISERRELTKHIRRQQSFVKIQLQNLMQRCQFAGQDENFVTIIVHENENTFKDDKIKKEAYQQIINSDSFIKDYNLIVDNLFIEFSNFNTGIQVADFIIGTLSGVARGYQTSNFLYTKYLKSKLRRNKEGTSVVGYGMIPIPNQKTSPTFSLKMSALYS